MSRAATTRADPLAFDLSGVEGARRAVAYAPRAVAVALSELIYDHARHHRTSILKHSPRNFNNPRRAQRFLASRLSGYGRLRPDVSSLADVGGESFMAALKAPGVSRAGVEFPGTAAMLRKMETGGTVSTDQPQIVPIGEGVNASGPFAGSWRASALRALREGRTDIVQRPGKPALVVQELDATRRAGQRIGERTIVIGVLVRRRRQRAVLGFFAQARRIQARHLAKYERLFALALTREGRDRLEREADAVRVGSAAYLAARSRWLAANPDDQAGAKRAANAAKRAARRAAIDRGGAR